MKKLVALLLVSGAALVAPLVASAHPLGNFTINRYSELNVSGGRAYVLYVLDLAEIPTFQARQQGVVESAYVRRITSNLRLTVDGRVSRLVPLTHALAYPEGQGGLETLRLEIVLRGPKLSATTTLRYEDANYASRLGWKEIVARSDHGARLLGASVPSSSVSDRLHAYPKDLLRSPLEVTSARVSVDPGSGDGVAPETTRGKALRAPDRVADSGFASLIGRDHLSALVILLSLAVAFFWGLVHALSPGHGKAIITAYLIGQRGTPRHAAYLGLIVTVTHTIGVFALGAVTLLLSEFIVPDTLYPWLNLTSGLLVVAIAASVFWARLSARKRPSTHEHDHAHHHHEHGAHVHSHGGRPHSHVPTEPGWRGLVAAGVSGGLIPCPSALVVLLAAISLHRIAFGLLLIVAFSAGLAITITGIGLIAVLARSVFGRVSFEGPLVRLLPAASAVVILVVGVAMTARAVPKIT